MMMYKQVFIVNNDLKMGKGKICAQVAHGAIMCYEKVKNNNPELIKKWQEIGQKKIVLKASLKEILEIKKTLDKENIPNCLVIDAGLTQIPSGSITVLAIGPWKEEEINKFTRHLKLL
ncbi:MAG: peptidyl-tRNA hydrolase Pth2 [Nanoarchaeota archaeon]